MSDSAIMVIVVGSLVAIGFVCYTIVVVALANASRQARPTPTRWESTTTTSVPQDKSSCHFDGEDGN